MMSSTFRVKGDDEAFSMVRLLTSGSIVEAIMLGNVPIPYTKNKSTMLAQEERNAHPSRLWVNSLGTLRMARKESKGMTSSQGFSSMRWNMCDAKSHVTKVV